MASGTRTIQPPNPTQRANGGTQCRVAESARAMPAERRELGDHRQGLQRRQGRRQADARAWRPSDKVRAGTTSCRGIARYHHDNEEYISLSS